MKERPILFKGAMVRAILDGNKTQTRRIIECICNSWHIDRVLGDWGLSVPPHKWDGSDPEPLWRWTGKKQPKAGDWVEVFQTEVDDHRGGPISCPFGTVGDRLWVRETWQFCDYDGPGGYPKTDIVYRADGETDDKRHGWVPSIHMPRWASRITLEVTGVRVERLNEISESDAISEGVTLPNPELETYYSGFKRLWQSINGPSSWSLNPWVWVIKFKRVTP
jgi:hypothetical protein